MISLRNIHLRFAARAWGEHREPGNLASHVVGHGIATTIMALLLGKVHVMLPLAGVARVSLGWVFVAALVAWSATLDLAGAAIAAGTLLVGTGMWRGEMYGEWASRPADLALLAAGLAPAALLVHAGHHVYYDFPGKHMGPPRGGRLLHAIGTLLTGFPLFVTLLLLRAGHRPSLRRAVEEGSHRELQPLSDRRWENWAGTAACTPGVTLYPRTASEIVAIVHRARMEKRRIRVVGAAYSWSPLVPTDDILICLCQMHEVELDLTDPERPLAIVGAGATGRDLNRVLEPRGFAVTSNVVMETVSWGGMIGVGAHGSGWDEQTLSDMVEAIELVDGRGEIRRFERGKDADDVMNAVRVSLGLFGVVYRITLRVVPAFNVRHQDHFLPVEEALSRLGELVPAGEYLDLYWMPFNERLWVRSWSRTGEPRSPRLPQGPWSGLSDRTHWGLWMSWLQTLSLRPLDWLTRFRPRWTPAVCRMKMALAAPNSRVVHINEATHFRSGIEAYRVGCVEFAFAIDPRFESVRRAWEAVTRGVDAWAARGRYPLTMVVNARFVRNSDCFLSPAHGNERTCYLEILGDHRSPDWKPFAHEVARAWMELPNARTHWGKEHGDIPGVEAHTRAVLGDDLHRFFQIRDAVGADPDRIFVNPFLERLLLAEKPAKPRRPLVAA